MEIIALGMGVQSVAMYLMSSTGHLPRADFAIMADPGKEREDTYRYMEFLLEWQQANGGIPIVVSRLNNLFQDLLDATRADSGRFVSIPAYVSNHGTVGMLRRQCTHEYKIRVMDRAIRDLYGLSKGQRCPPTGIWKGISMDEIDRMTHPRESYKTHYYPFTGFWFGKNDFGRLVQGCPMTWAGLMTWLASNGYKVPVKSACVFCPYRSDSSWRALKQESLADFAAAVKVDEAIRKDGRGKIKNERYLHKSLRPLAEIDFGNYSTMDFGECSDNCGV